MNVNEGVYTFKIESPTKMFFETLCGQPKTVILHNLIQTVQTLFHIVKVYGYFYCDK